MKQQTRFSQKQENNHEQQTESQTGREFANSDDLLWFDAAQTNVPPEIAERLKRTTRAAVPSSPSGWLKRFFGGNHQ